VDTFGRTTSSIGFNNKGQVVYTEFNPVLGGAVTSSTIVLGTNISAATLNTPVTRGTTYIQLIEQELPSEIGVIYYKVGIEVYRNGRKYYEKYMKIAASTWVLKTPYRVESNITSKSWEVSTKAGVTVFNPSTPISTSVFETITNI
jgi:hypothetical protein